MEYLGIMPIDLGVKMATLFLALIYLAFISLGLPDSILGAAWPSMRQSLGLDLSAAGVVSVIVTGGTIVSSLMAGKILSKFGTGKTMIVSVALTAGALLGICFAPNFIWLCLLAIPLGIGGGSVDAGLNNFVALHYKASHMSWLHCFWGVGATAGPFIMSYALQSTQKWQNGYFTIGIIQWIVVALLLFSLPLWKKYEPTFPGAQVSGEKTKKISPFKLAGAPATLLSFFGYCALEACAGLWGASFLADYKGLPPQLAAQFGAAFFFGITVGRFLCGFVALKLSSKTLIFVGESLCIISAIVLMLPISATACGFVLVFLGLGCAPIYPSIIHETPKSFGAENSATLIGLQMASAYAGIFIVSPLTGVLGTYFGIQVYPMVLLACAVFMLLMSTIANRQIAKAKGK